jgi:signal transduction histidine kinase
MAEDDRLRDSYEGRVRTLTEEIRQRERELAILSEVAGRVHGAEEVQKILDIALEEILDQMELKAAWIFVGDDSDKKLQLAASRGVSPQYLEDVRNHGLGECLCPEVFWSGHRMQARNTTQCPRMPDIVDGLREPVAHACIPMKFEGATKGVLNVAALPGEQFTEEQLRFLETLGHQVGLAVERARHREAAARLYEEARRAYQELKDAQKRILSTEKMAVLGTFASGLAHEVRNPLNSIGLQLSLLERRIVRVDESVGREMKDLTRIIHEEVQRLNGLVEDFLLFSRADRLEHRPGDLPALVDEVVQLLAPEASALGVKVRRFRIGRKAPRLDMDAEKMKQVVINLLRNAFEAMPNGGEVQVETGIVDGKARLVVRDTGPGLPEGVDVFELFFTTKPKGTGLGLPIVQQIVLQHGGEIAARSEPGKGATFTISLPMPEAGEQKGEVRA